MENHFPTMDTGETKTQQISDGSHFPTMDTGKSKTQLRSAGSHFQIIDSGKTMNDLADQLISVGRTLKLLKKYFIRLA